MMLQVPTVINGDAISEVGYVLGTSADNYRSAYLEAAFVQNLVSSWSPRQRAHWLCSEAGYASACIRGHIL